MDSEGIMIAQARAKIDADIAALEERIRALRYERNRLTPIARLPPEVMSHIFKLLQQKYLGALYSDDTFPWDYPRWTRVTRVSQHWRQIALSSKSLWDVIPMISDRKYLTAYATESWNRLGSAPFFLIVKPDRYSRDHYSKEDPNPALWKLAAEECHRIRFIRGVVGRSVANFSKPMPLLEYFEITRDSCELSPSIISPSLRILKVSWGNFSWDWPALPHLTTLCIKGPEKKVSYNSLIEILKKTPCLKDAVLEDIFSPSSSTSKDAVPALLPVLPPVLSSFRCLSSPLCLDLISRLRFTASSSIDIGIGDIRPAALLQSLQLMDRICQDLSVTIRHVGLSTRNDIDWVGSLLLQEAENRPLLRVSFSSWGQTEWGNFLKTFAILYLNNMEIESLSIQVINDVAVWKQSGIGQLSNLRRLDLGGNGVEFLLYIVQDYEEFKQSRDRHHLAFTSLEEVRMRGLNLVREVKYPVCAALAGREKAGYRFQKMVIKGGHITEDAKKQLRKYVDEIVF